MNIIGITMGCPSGIGPEIILRYFEEQTDENLHKVVVLGDLAVLEKCKAELDFTVPITRWQPGTAVPDHEVPVVSLSSLSATAVQWGKPTHATANAMVAYIENGVKFIEQGWLHGIVTCPISKESLNSAGHHFPGHTEMLAYLTGSENYAMMMAGSKLNITLATIHCPLSEVPATLSIQLIHQLIHITHKALSIDFGIKNPQIAVAGLNPHGGENQLFGHEELHTISPAVSLACNDGIAAFGPFPPDTIFVKASQGKYDAVVCMYHDQGLIPFKLLHFNDGVNVTLGLPIVRTSVDHGTAYDIAGQGIASADSLKEAVKLAAKICCNRNHCKKG